jgi:hypothetical protein
MGKTNKSPNKYGQKSRKDKAVATACLVFVILIVAVFAVTAMNEGGLFIRMTKNMSGETITVDGAMMSFFMNDSIVNFYNQYYIYMYYGMISLDLTKDLHNQTLNANDASYVGSTKGITWYDYFLGNVKSEVTYYVTLAEAAKKVKDKDLSLTKDDYAEIDATIKDISALDGTLNVMGGTTVLKGSDADVIPEFVTNGIVYHADSTKGITATTNANGVVCVNRWDSQTDNGYYAVRSGGSDVTFQKLIYDPEVGMPTVDITGYNACFMWKDEAGNDLNLSNIRSVFWMVGSQNGGGWLLGGGTNSSGELSYVWHRGIHYTTNPDTGARVAWVGNTNVCPLVHSAASEIVRNAKWYKNGTKVTPTSTSAHLSGGWDQISMIVADESVSANASGFAFDGRSRKVTDSSNHNYNGHQRLGEVIIYDRVVSEEERVKIEAYLRCKWHHGLHQSATNLVLQVAEGAEVELEGAQKFESIIGDGIVRGTVSALTLIADPVSTGFAVDGTYDIAHATCICLENLSAWDRKSYITVLSATDFSGKDNLNSVKFVGEVDDALASRLRLCVRNGELVVRKAAGAVVIMR